MTLSRVVAALALTVSLSACTSTYTFNPGEIGPGDRKTIYVGDGVFRVEGGVEGDSLYYRGVDFGGGVTLGGQSRPVLEDMINEVTIQKKKGKYEIHEKGKGSIYIETRAYTSGRTLGWLRQLLGIR